jgi:LPXTG-site transpeptidase (sortase) family protein
MLWKADYRSINRHRRRALEKKASEKKGDNFKYMKRLIAITITLITVITVMLTPALTVPALAADYSFDAKDMDNFYNPTPYEEVYGSQYNYGGVNAADMYDTSQLPGIFTPSPENARTSGAYDYTNTDIDSGVVGYSDITYTSMYADEKTPADFTVTTDGRTAGTGGVLTEATAFTPSNTLVRADGSIGTLEIPSLGISVKVYDGTDSDSLAKGVGHFPETSGWNGNISVAGHNRGAKYTIGAIKDLKQGDVIRYTTLLGTRTYAVSFIGYISNTDMTYLAATADNRITLITCLAGQPDLRVCVQARPHALR